MQGLCWCHQSSDLLTSVNSYCDGPSVYVNSSHCSHSDQLTLTYPLTNTALPTHLSTKTVCALLTFRMTAILPYFLPAQAAPFHRPTNKTQRRGPQPVGRGSSGGNRVLSKVMQGHSKHPQTSRNFTRSLVSTNS
jgi:hypothetical protein